ncbi:MAG TPA: hypothetical protein VFY23_06170, partial [Candidatus Limnocylindrales bacterium]|nr:hypothetical protein [Candidatus Limnocylindrales bacterium]
GAASDHRKGFAMSRRYGGWAAIAGSLVWFAGFLANAFDGSDEAWPTSGIIIVGTILLLVALAGLSALQARERPALVWAAFLVPTVGAVAMADGLLAMGLVGDAQLVGGLGGWGIGMLGLLTLLAGSGLFAYATWRTGTDLGVGPVLLGIAAILTVPTTLFMVGVQPWEPLAPIVMFATLALFAGGWLLTGVAAVRADRPALATTGGAA